MSGNDHSLENRLTDYEELIRYAIGIGGDAAHYCVSAEAWVPKLARIAERIEELNKRTCEVKHWGGGVFYFSCGHESREWPKPNFCPKCGAQVID